MIARRRHDRIISTLQSGGPVEVGQLARTLGVSPATVRRDLAQLESDGLLQRVHGGAAPVRPAEPPYDVVADDHHAGKAAVAAAAAGLVADGQVVLLDIGTTVALVARALRGRGTTVITSSIPVYEELATDESTEIVLLGGTVRRNYRSLVGYLTEQALHQVHADVAFLGTSGVRADGTVLDTTAVEVPVKRAMLAAADRRVLVADAGKFPGSGCARVCDAGELEVLVTEPGAPPATLERLAERGVEVVRAAAPHELLDTSVTAGERESA